MRRPYSLDLLYPVPELKPFIGKKSNVKDKMPKIPVRIGKVSGEKDGGQTTDTEQLKEDKPRAENTLGTTKRSLSHTTRKPTVFSMRKSRGSANSSKDRG